MAEIPPLVVIAGVVLLTYMLTNWRVSGLEKRIDKLEIELHELRLKKKG